MIRAPSPIVLAIWGSGLFVGLAIAGCYFDDLGHLVWLVVAVIFAAMALALED